VCPNTCCATATVWRSISLHVSPTTGIGGGTLLGACCARRAADPSAALCRRIQPFVNASRFNRLPPGPSGDSAANFEIPFDDGIRWGCTTASECRAHSSPTEGTAHGRLTFCSGDAFDDGAQVFACGWEERHKRVCGVLRGGRDGAPAAKAELLRAIAAIAGCRNVLTIGQRMSRLQSHGTSEPVDAQRRRPRTGLNFHIRSL
jgi:hypothetical protein